MADVARKLEPPEVGTLVQLRDVSYEWEPGGDLIAPGGGIEALVEAVKSGSLDSYLRDWAPKANHGEFRDFNTILFHAVEGNWVELVSALLERGADPDRGVAIGAPEDYFEDESTPLGASVKSEECARLLLESGADYNKFSNGSPVLLLAADECPGVVRLLLEAGADPLLRTGIDTPLSLSLRRSNNEENVALLRAAARRRIEGKRVSSLLCRAGKKPKDPATERGIRSFADTWLEHDWLWYAVLVKAPLEETSRTLHEHYPGSELHQSPKGAIFDEHRPVFAVSLKGMPWTIVYENMGARFDLDLRAVTQALSEKLQCEAVGFGAWEGHHYESGRLLEEHLDWDPEETYGAPQ